MKRQNIKHLKRATFVLALSLHLLGDSLSAAPEDSANSAENSNLNTPVSQSNASANTQNLSPSDENNNFSQQDNTFTENPPADNADTPLENTAAQENNSLNPADPALTAAPEENANTFADPAVAEAPAAAALSGPSFLYLSRGEGKSIGLDGSYTGVEIVSFFDQYETFVPFAGLEAYYLDKGRGCFASIGGGVRFLSGSSDFIYGINLYYDYRQSHRSSFSQASIGLEGLGDIWNFRFNGYAPIGRSTAHLSTCLFDDYIGGYFIQKKEYLSNRGGADFELEAKIKQFPWGNVRVAFGGYYFQGGEGKRRIYGPQYRVIADLTRYISISALGSRDRVFGTKFQGQLMVTLPLGDDPQDYSNLYQRVQRNNYIVLEHHCCWKSNY